MGGFNNPDMTWAQLERALSDRRPRPIGPKENYDNVSFPGGAPAPPPRPWWGPNPTGRRLECGGYRTRSAA